MTRLHPLQLVHDQFRESDGAGNHRPRRVAWLSLVPPLCVVAIIFYTMTCLPNVGALLTATSIITGLIFTMALRFWERSIDARKDPAQALDADLLTTLDRMRTHLAWTVVVGVASTACLAAIAVFVTGLAPVPVSALAAALFAYQLTLVLAALWQFYEASYLLRR